MNVTLKILKRLPSSSVLNDMELEKMEKELSQYTEEEYGKFSLKKLINSKKQSLKIYLLISRSKM